MESTLNAIKEFIEVIIKLRSPNGCPWDLEQTSLSMRNNLIEEAFECVEAINNQDIDHIKEELGDIFLVAAMIAYINEQEGKFTISDVFDNIKDKLIRRHPHVFGDSNISSSNKVIEQWNDIKENIEGRRKKDSVLDGIKKYLPAMDISEKMQKKASKNGFDWSNLLDIMDKLDEEKSELLEAVYSNDKIKIENEIGDLIFTTINIARFLKIEATPALMRTNYKFEKRFLYMEKEMKKLGKPLAKDNIDMMEKLWNQAKKDE